MGSHGDRGSHYGAGGGDGYDSRPNPPHQATSQSRQAYSAGPSYTAPMHGTDPGRWAQKPQLATDKSRLPPQHAPLPSPPVGMFPTRPVDNYRDPRERTHHEEYSNNSNHHPPPDPPRREAARTDHDDRQDRPRHREEDYAPARHSSSHYDSAQTRHALPEAPPARLRGEYHRSDTHQVEHSSRSSYDRNDRNDRIPEPSTSS